MTATEIPLSSTPSLFARLGGAAAIDTAVEQFYLRVLADVRLRDFYAHVNMPVLKKHGKDFFSTALGGPAVYQGAAMKRAHARFSIEESHFNSIATHLRETLAGLTVPADLITEVMTAVGSLAADIVNTPATSDP